MVADRNVERGAGVGEPSGGVEVGTAGTRIAGRMVVDEDDTRRSELQRPNHDRAGRKVDAADGAAGHYLIGEKTVCRVEKQHSQYFSIVNSAEAVEIIHKLRQVRNDAPAFWSILIYR